MMGRRIDPRQAPAAPAAMSGLVSGRSAAQEAAMRLNPLLVDTATPPIPEAQGWARGYGGGAGPLIDLSQAVPGYPPHPEMLARLSAAAGRATSASYGPILGDSVLREAYAAHVSGLYGAAIRAEETAITTGCNQAFFVAMLALARAGESVLLPTPWYFNHKMTLDMLGVEARPLACRPEAGFVPDPRDAARLIDASTRAIVLVTPNNPTGAVYPRETIAGFASLCAERGLALVLDETYRDFIVERPHNLFGSGAWRDSLIALTSFSKSYCLPGYRLGAMIASTETLAEVAKILDTLQICAPRVAQGAVAWGFDALAGWRAENCAEIARRAECFTAAIERRAGWRIESIGSYFAYLRHPFEGCPAAVVAQALAEERGVLCLPGPYFGPGQEQHLRAAFANASVETLGQLGHRLDGFSLRPARAAAARR
jgi:aspartate/methionine/tyrosine aminotransferase